VLAFDYEIEYERNCSKNKPKGKHTMQGNSHNLKPLPVEGFFLFLAWIKTD
jgi:hypothetical protein